MNRSPCTPHPLHSSACSYGTASCNNDRHPELKYGCGCVLYRCPECQTIYCPEHGDDTGDPGRTVAVHEDNRICLVCAERLAAWS